MVVKNRIAYLKGCLSHGAKLVASVTSNPKTGIQKVKIVVDPSTRIEPQKQWCANSVLDMVAHACDACHVADKGHRHSSGLSEVHFYISNAPLVSKATASMSSATVFKSQCVDPFDEYYANNILPDCGERFMSSLYLQFDADRAVRADSATASPTSSQPGGAKKVSFADSDGEVSITDAEEATLNSVWAVLRAAAEEILMTPMRERLPEYWRSCFGPSNSGAVDAASLKAFKDHIFSAMLQLVQENLTGDHFNNLRAACRSWLDDRLHSFIEGEVDAAIALQGDG
eukprot:TRINITY_DN11752_c1_g2_i1.p1 TRINITY_DN11752_c1_g2~~TRINITY_DN11752_c1_g2_i1.p1  ORF type:complete len:285 (-),score=44.71 TRINITY_DN11752_c1_g2_i1:172-1026(-)